MGERAAAAKEADGGAGERGQRRRRRARHGRKEATAEAIAAVKPRLRGVSHEWAFFVSLFFGAGLIVLAKTPKATLAVAIYAVSLSALLGTSALYHRVNWKRPEVRAWMRRLDHSMIFFLIAGTYTPFALLVLNGAARHAILVVVWIGAIAGAVVEMIWIDHPKWVAALIYLSLGWVAASPSPSSGPAWASPARCWSPPAASSTRRAPSSTRPSGPTRARRLRLPRGLPRPRHRRRRRPLRRDRLLRAAARPERRGWPRPDRRFT